MNDFIRTLVGDEWQVVHYDVFLEVHEQLAARFRARGYVGEALDEAIVDALPGALALALGYVSATVH